jgi:hypothetical protein
MRKVVAVSLFTVAVVASTFALERDAAACGGCFGPPPPPTESPTIVTDHRMVLSVARDQSTLYDQIRYQGSPSSFAWVLPIAGEVQVGLSADVVFAALDQMTQTVIQAPPQNCPPPPNCGSSSGGAMSSADNAGAPQDAGVEVTKREVVGPYDTVQLKATDPTALQRWLGDNGFVIPNDVKPVIDQYVAEKFDFLALKLLPGKGVKDMRPVRVSTKGANVALPLRMVAAGTGATVGVTLWVVGEGRYEPTNFPTFTIKADELEWDWTQNKSNYVDLRAAKTSAGGGKAWEIESSSTIYRANVEQIVTRYAAPGAQQEEIYAEQDYLPVKDAQGNVVKTASQVRREDLTTLFYGIPGSQARVTRLRADLLHSALATDLLVGAPQDQSELSPFRQITKEKNQPLCPVYNGCQQVGTAPRDEAIAQQNGGHETFSCTTTSQDKNTSASWLAAGGAALALALTRAARRRRR